MSQSHQHHLAKILVISPDNPWPPDTGGKIRIWNILKGLAGEYEVHLFALCTEIPSASIQDEQFAELASTHFILHSSKRRLVQGLLAMIRGQPFHVGALKSERLREELVAFSDKQSPEVVLATFLWLTPYLNCFHDACLVIDQQNSDRQWWEGYVRSVRAPLKRLIASFNLHYVKRFEEWAYPQYDLCFSVCEEDKLLTRPLLRQSAQVTVIPNGVDIQFFKPMPLSVEQNTLVFVGSMDLVANITAVQYFVDHILPRIWRENPKVRFKIVGRRPHKSIRRLAADPRIEITGTVDDVRPYLAHAQIIVIPHVEAGGTKLKVLTSMAMGKAIVATPASVRGLDVHPLQDLLIADNPKDFASKVLHLLENRELCIELGHHARQTVVLQYSWASAICRIKNEIATVLNRTASFKD